MRLTESDSLHIKSNCKSSSPGNSNSEGLLLIFSCAAHCGSFIQCHYMALLNAGIIIPANCASALCSCVCALSCMSIPTVYIFAASRTIILYDRNDEVVEQQTPYVACGGYHHCTLIKRNNPKGLFVINSHFVHNKNDDEFDYVSDLFLSTATVQASTFTW